MCSHEGDFAGICDQHGDFGHMTRPNAADAGCAKEAKLPRRDWILLPILSLLTMCLLAGSVELCGHEMFARISTVGENCLVVKDPSDGARGIPNCVISGKDC